MTIHWVEEAAIDGKIDVLRTTGGYLRIIAIRARRVNGWRVICHSAGIDSFTSLGLADDANLSDVKAAAIRAVEERLAVYASELAAMKSASEVNITTR